MPQELLDEIVRGRTAHGERCLRLLAPRTSDGDDIVVHG